MDYIEEILERRKHDRLEKEFVFSYSRFEELPRTSLDLEGLILDIGGGGIRFLASREWLKNDLLLMKLDFKRWYDEGVIRVPVEISDDCSFMLVVGKVMWSQETLYDGQFEVGVMFIARMETEKKTDLAGNKP